MGLGGIYATVAGRDRDGCGDKGAGGSLLEKFEIVNGNKTGLRSERKNAANDNRTRGQGRCGVKLKYLWYHLPPHPYAVVLSDNTPQTTGNYPYS
ncbi:MAG: hypothetical protein NVS9B4_22680 [Candidatus Acidiferrum sp.]